MQRNEVHTRSPPLDLLAPLGQARPAPRKRRNPRPKHHVGDLLIAKPTWRGLDMKCDSDSAVDLGGAELSC